ncbi:hypothetical protein K2173_004497 [Erythroxylum novogranatense]|uniref:Myb-related protein 123 n=1 Tax=Erythroxylum novogranatense TaxID=1862640 RepID=A0AAV8TKB3_9ROSI|nr:hypothetical protein K2173_004497 [Erythroxylum novogranatense]
MGRRPCCAKEGINRGSWSVWEDQILINYIKAHGDGKWRDLPQKAGLKRCGKSCRLRWLNYLRPDIKRGNISVEEEELIVRLHKLLGNRWSLIAGRLPGRTDNEIKNYWNTNLRKKFQGKSKKNPKCSSPSAQLKHLTSGTLQKPQVIRAKAVRCTKVILPPPPSNRSNDEIKKYDIDERTSGPQLEGNLSADFLVNFDVNDLLSEFLNTDLFQAAGNECNNEKGIECGPHPHDKLSPCSEQQNCTIPASMPESWSSLHPCQLWGSENFTFLEEEWLA